MIVAFIQVSQNTYEAQCKILYISMSNYLSLYQYSLLLIYYPIDNTDTADSPFIHSVNQF